MHPYKTLTCTLAAALLFAGSAHAAYLYDWSQAQMITDSAPDSPGLQASNDITSAWHGYASGTHYFRIDLGGTLSTSTNYGIYIDSKAGGGTTLPATGIDYYLLSDYVKAVWDTTESRWKTNSFSSTNGQSMVFQYSENNGKSLEWKITPNNEWNFGTNFNWLAATTSDSATLDKTQVAATPIPGAVWLLGSGIVGLIGLKRRKNFAALPAVNSNTL